MRHTPLYGSSRVSCAFCILSSHADLACAAACELNADIYRDLVHLEAESTFAFQSARWLADVALQLLAAELGDAVAEAKRGAAIREAGEARIPAGLLYSRRWPARIPTFGEAELSGEVRQAVAKAVGIEVDFTDADSIRRRYEQLMALRQTSVVRKR
jgi:hypothetical protein